VRPVQEVCRPLSQERGSATVVMLAVIAVVLMLTISGLTLASAVLASHRARTAADLAALAAAGALIRGESPGGACVRAARVATANHGQLHSCMAAGEEVGISLSVLAGVQGLGVATARSRAGPAPGR
jgi:secretion/DNA translocation related TadE-like protein